MIVCKMEKDKILTGMTQFGPISYYKNDLAFVNELLNKKMYEEDLVIALLQNVIKQSRVILDIGAHAGSHTIMYKKINRSVTIYAFEPQAKMFDLLNHNLQINNIKDVIAYNTAVGNINTTTTLNNKILDQISLDIEYGTSNYSNLGGIQIGENGEDVSVITIDEMNLDECSFIKIDVEGFERFVIDGAKNTISKFKPTILFEHNFKSVSEEVVKKFDPDKKIKDPIDILSSMSYNIVQIDKLGNCLAVYAK